MSVSTDKPWLDSTRPVVAIGPARSIWPLFIPLKREFFEQFKAGTKNTEYRLRGSRWNAETCWIGRTVVLSKGYGKKHRLTGKIVGFHYDNLPSRLPGWSNCYGSGGSAACIKIEVDR